MNYFSIDIKIGLNGIKLVDKKNIKFHDDLLRNIFPYEKNIKRMGLDHSIPINHSNYIHHADKIQAEIDRNIRNLQKNNNPIDIFIFDFTSNPFVFIREPLLLALADEIVAICNKNICNSFIILLPKIPGDNNVSIKKFTNLNVEISDPAYRILIISNTGSVKTFNKKVKLNRYFKNRHQKLVNNLYGDIYSRLERRCIRRLGHFKNYNTINNEHKCRIYSYFLYKCEHELYSLFKKWWNKYNQSKKIILYDLKNNNDFRSAVIAFAEEYQLETYRCVDVLNKPELSSKIRNNEEVVLVLDVIETGSTLLSYINEFLSLGIHVSKDVIVAINKSGSRNINIQNFIVHGLIARTGTSNISPCDQCKLDLDVTPDSHEVSLKIRSFDMHYMANSVGYIPEPSEEVPRNVGKQYKSVPDYEKLIDSYGDWLTYKMDLALKEHYLPEDWFIIHPDEASSTAISSKFQLLYDNKLFIVRIPRVAISNAQNNNNNWEGIISNFEDHNWFNQLKSINKTKAVILDIFNGSGSTCLSLLSLLNYFNLETFGYLSFVDYDPDQQNNEIKNINKLSLYDWYNPRKLNRG